MSRNLWVSAIDLDMLKGAAGSRRTDLFDAVMASRRDVISLHDRRWKRMYPGYTPIEAALRRVIDGAITTDLVPLFQYEHAVALLADTLGTPLDASAFNEAAATLYRDVEALVRAAVRDTGPPEHACFSVDEVLRLGPPIPVPLDPEMPLGSGYMTRDEVSACRRALGGADLERVARRIPELTWPREALEGALQYKRWMEDADRRSFGLFLHN